MAKQRGLGADILVILVALILLTLALSGDAAGILSKLLKWLLGGKGILPVPSGGGKKKNKNDKTNGGGGGSTATAPAPKPATSKQTSKATAGGTDLFIGGRSWHFSDSQLANTIGSTAANNLENSQYNTGSGIVLSNPDSTGAAATAGGLTAMQNELRLILASMG